MTAGFSLMKRIDLQQLASTCLFARMTPKRKRRYFQSVSLKLYTPEKRITALIYATGKVVLIGADKELQLLDAMNQICSITRVCARDSVYVSNYVFTMEMTPTNLPSLFNQFKKLSDKRIASIDLTPELFPALILELSLGHKVTIFRTGKVIITGCRRREEGSKAFRTLDEMLSLFNE